MRPLKWSPLLEERMVDLTGLEPVTSSVSTRHSNQLSYRSHFRRLLYNCVSVMCQTSSKTQCFGGITLQCQGRYPQQLTDIRTVNKALIQFPVVSIVCQNDPLGVAAHNCVSILCQTFRPRLTPFVPRSVPR